MRISLLFCIKSILCSTTWAIKLVSGTISRKNTIKDFWSFFYDKIIASWHRAWAFNGGRNYAAASWRRHRTVASGAGQHVYAVFSSGHHRHIRAPYTRTWCPARHAYCFLYSRYSCGWRWRCCGLVRWYRGAPVKLTARDTGSFTHRKRLMTFMQWTGMRYTVFVRRYLVSLTKKAKR